MATYTINIDEKTDTGRNLVAFLRSMKDVVSFTDIKKRTGLDEAFEDKKEGRVFDAKDAADLIDKCLA